VNKRNKNKKNIPLVRGIRALRCLSPIKPNNMKYLAPGITILILLIGITVAAQEFEKNLTSFDKIVVSPKINLILEKGDQESIRIRYSNIDAGKINIEVTNGKLQLYLDNAKVIDKRERTDEYNSKMSIYRNAEVTAYVTYAYLTALEIRGEQEVTCLSKLENDKFKLKVYGESEVTLESLYTQKFKAVAYGENKIKIKEGKANYQRYRLYGENKIDTRALASSTVSTTIYGEGRLTINASDEVRISAFGEPQINVSGTSYINKGIIIGRVDIRKNN